MLKESLTRSSRENRHDKLQCTVERGHRGIWVPWARKLKHTVGVVAAKVGRARSSGDSKGFGKIGGVNNIRASNGEG